MPRYPCKGCPRIDYEWIHILTYNVFIANVFGRYTTAVTIALVTHWTFHKVKSISASYIKLVLQKLNNQIFELIKYSYVNILYLLPIHLFNCIQDMRVTYWPLIAILIPQISWIKLAISKILCFMMDLFNVPNNHLTFVFICSLFVGYLSYWK